MSRATTLLDYTVLAAAGVGLQIAGLTSHRIPTIGRALACITGRRAGRWLLLSGWLWVGWHLFAR